MQNGYPLKSSIDLHPHSGVRMFMKKMTEHGDERGRVLYFSPVKGFVDILDNHRPDAFGAMRLVKEVARQRGSRHLSKMFMLADRGYFVRLQAAHSNAVFQANHR
ncbi:MAG: hypothetical protein WAL40_15475 [Rhodoplanes sp.]